MNIEAKITEILMNNSQKSIIGWIVEADDFKHVATEIVKKLNLGVVVNWLPFKEENYELFTRLAKEKKLLKYYDDGTIIKDGEKEPLAIMTHFAEEI